MQAHMKNDLLIQIPKPCHENWDAMTPDAKGRFCGSCAKVVVDFSMMTDNEIARFLKNNTGSTCGHFTRDQLERPIIETQLQPKRTWRYWLASIASLLAMLEQSNGQNKSSSKQLDDTSNAIVVDRGQLALLGKVAYRPIENKVLGRVVDEQNRPLQGASILIKDSKIGTSTKADGTFALVANKKNVTVVVSYIGYITKELLLVANDETKLIKLALAIDDMMMGEVIITKSTKKRKNLVEKPSLLDSLSRLVTKAFTIYPNPISTNEVINIAIKEAGSYEVHLLNNQSKILMRKVLNTQTSKQHISYALPIGINQGIYYVRLINTTTNKEWTTQLVVQ